MSKSNRRLAVTEAEVGAILQLPDVAKGLPPALYEKLQRFLARGVFIQRIDLSGPEGRDTVEQLYANAKRKGRELELRSAGPNIVEVYDLSPPPQIPERGTPEWMEQKREEYRSDPVNQRRFAQQLRDAGIIASDV